MHFRELMNKYFKKIKEAVNWSLYVLFLKLVSLRKSKNKHDVNTTLIKDYSLMQHDDVFWFFCSTIGELNACAPFINRKYMNGKVVILTDRIFYKSSYLDKFPDSLVVEVNSDDNQISSLLKILVPNDFYVCEIPCSPNDAPCRLPYEILREIKNKKVNMFIINGWLYENEPACIQDKVERYLFRTQYFDIFDGIAVQTNEIKRRMVEIGADSKKIEVTGNMKFDAINNLATTAHDAISNSLIATLMKHNNVIVAGCLIDEDEYRKVTKAFVDVLIGTPDAVYVLVPRHPEKNEQLEIITKILSEYGMSYIFKSSILKITDFNHQVLILDTIGELRNFYECGSICYVGKDHNVLEPLFLGKKVVVPDGWNKKYPSYPVFDIARENGLLAIDSEDSLGVLFSEQLRNNIDKSNEVKTCLQKLSGATIRNDSFINKLTCGV